MENMGKAAEAPVTSKSSIFFSVIAPPLALRRNTEPEYIPITCSYDSLYPQPGRRVGILDNRSAVAKAAQAHVLDRPMIWLSIFPREREKASANRQGVGRLNMWKSQYKTFFRRGSP